MGIVHNVLWADISNLREILCFWAKLCAFKAKDVFCTGKERTLRAILSDVFVTVHIVSNLLLTNRLFQH